MPKISAFLLPLLIGVSSTSHAQVYKSTDADGNVVYSDTPATESKTIQIREPNVADPVEAPAQAPAEPKPEETAQEEPQPEVIVITDEDDGHLGIAEKRRRAERRERRQDRRK